jgi:cytochrome c biogenesis factor
MFFFVVAFLFFLITAKKNSSGKVDCFFLLVPILLNITTYGYFAYLFLSHQFYYDYVYQYSNLSMPKSLLLASSWAGQAGSLLLWSFFCCFSLLIAYRAKSMRKLVLPILLFHQIVILLLVWNAKPFAKSAMLFSDGLGMNPALSHILMVIHPPFAFIGYSFLSMLYAFSIASLINQKFDEWLISAKKYALIALSALSITTILGSLWAYEAIGWGGYWSFDPIENGTLITCLLILAFIHVISLYKKQKWGLPLIYFLSILIYSSVIHMVLLIRSGLLKNLTQHSYSGTGLLYALLFSDILTFLIPVVLLAVKTKHIPTRKLNVPLLSKSGRTRASVWLLIAMSAVLFIDLNQPLLANYFSLSPTQFSPLLQKIFFATSLLAYFFIFLTSSPFANSRSIRFHSLGKTLIQLLLSSIISLLFLISLHTGLSKKALLLFLILLVPILGITKTFMDMIKLKWFSRGKDFSHIVMCLLLLSIILTNIYYKEEIICLEKDVPYATSSFTATMTNQIQTIPQYLGEKEQYELVFSMEPYQFTAYPSLWKYQRNKGTETQKTSYIKILPEADIIVVPKQKGLKTLLLNQETNLEGLIVTLKEYARTKNDQGFWVEKATINFQKEIDISGGKTHLSQEDCTLTRRLTQKGLAIESTKVTPTLLGEELEWISTENETTILIRSPYIDNTYEFEILTKPYMLLLRLSYFLLIFSLFWMLLMNQWEKKLAMRYKKSHPRHTVTRDRHAHYHQGE